MNNIQLNYEKLSRYTKDRIIVSVMLLCVLTSSKLFFYGAYHRLGWTPLPFFVFVPSCFIFVVHLFSIIDNITKLTHSYKIIKINNNGYMKKKIKYKARFIPFIYFTVESREPWLYGNDIKKLAYKHKSRSHREYKEYITKTETNIEPLEL